MANNNENKKNKQSLNDMLMNILFNIVIPVMILKKVPEHWDNENAAVVALCVALSFPIGFFIFDYYDNFRYFRTRHTWSTVTDEVHTNGLT